MTYTNNDLETKLALVMNTKVVPCDILNLFKVFLRFHKQFIPWLHANPNIGKEIK